MKKEEKGNKLWAHSEKLALAWALISTPNKKDKIIMHNTLRMCHDCHGALKLISKLENRQFVIRDANRFHHFDQGMCSCNDYW